MGYQALLFCPDEKTARTVTQVLSELEFNVEPCVETFAAVKKLMGTHFDAVVVDCDNEQNATLLFKSARNSTSNQASLAVAVVEGQAGVAKAFRIGANLVLTKPINIEQAKGTLRVARGLLRKGDPVKPGAPAAAPTPAAAPSAPPKPAAAKPGPVVKPLVSAAAPPRPPVASPAWPAQGAVPAAHNPVAHAPARVEDEVPEISLDDDVPAPMATAPAPTATSKISAPLSQAGKFPASLIPPASSPAKPAPKPAMQAGSSATLGGAAASAPAPAREAEDPALAASSATKTHEFDSPKSEAETSELHSAAQPAPTFTFGGANVPETSGGSKKILLVVAAVVIVAAAAYAGWSYFQGRASRPVATAPTQSPRPISRPLTENSAPPQPAAASTTPAPDTSTASQPPAPATAGKDETTTSAADTTDSAPENEAPASRPHTRKPAAVASTPEKSESSTTPEPAPLVVKGGAVPKTQPKTEAADAAAPSMVGMATGAGAPPPDLVSDSANAPAPVLQSVHISQGVSQGLLIKKVQPIYPRAALTMHIEGAVQLAVTISKSGDISKVKILSGDARLASAAVEAVRQWKYKPYLLDGEPVEIQTNLTLNFKAPN
ncbi:MAG TPA: TonB family protein [Terriglobales bacterium]|nr:TonB family protein [Terriglobales bacterium]